ncbi:cupin domain-containing protein [Tritonibacter mobilis]|nr:cupin domain-containing protein [Tritonibacter mobilis]
MAVKVIRGKDIDMKHRGGPPGEARVGRAISSDLSPTMAAGIAEFDGYAIAWQVHYDEIVHVLEGRFLLEVGGEVHMANAGDTMWIPKGTRLSYGGDKARIFYAVYPGNWREKLTIYE